MGIWHKYAWVAYLKKPLGHKFINHVQRQVE